MDAFDFINTPNEFDWQRYYEEFESFLAPEDKPMFWLCPSCQCINATVIGEKACCVECGVRPINPEPMIKAVL